MRKPSQRQLAIRKLLWDEIFHQICLGGFVGLDNGTTPKERIKENKVFIQLVKREITPELLEKKMNLLTLPGEIGYFYDFQISRAKKQIIELTEQRKQQIIAHLLERKNYVNQ